MPSTSVGAGRGLRPKLHSRRRAVGLSLVAAVLATAVAAAVGLTLTATSPSSALGAAKKALAATAATSSGTITVAFSHDGSSYSGDTTRWNGDAIEVTRGDHSQLGPDQALILIAGGAYLEHQDGTWLHYATASGVGPKVGPIVELARNNVAGNTATQVLSLATGLTQTTQADGSTIYTGTIPDSPGDPGVDPNDDSILRMIANLTDGADNQPGAPGGYHHDLRLAMTVGADGLVDQISLTYQQQGTGSAGNDGRYTQTVSYSRLGATAPITPPAASTPAAPVIWSPGPACPPAPRGPCGG
jgi:hypothetical protein